MRTTSLRWVGGEGSNNHLSHLIMHNLVVPNNMLAMLFIMYSFSNGTVSTSVQSLEVISVDT